MPRELDFTHNRNARKEYAPLYHIDRAMSAIKFDKYIDSIYYSKKKAVERGTYNHNRALGMV